VDKFKFANPNRPSISKGAVLHMTQYVVDGIAMTSHDLGFSKFEHVSNIWTICTNELIFFI